MRLSERMMRILASLMSSLLRKCQRLTFMDQILSFHQQSIKSTTAISDTTTNHKGFRGGLRTLLVAFDTPTLDWDGDTQDLFGFMVVVVVSLLSSSSSSPKPNL